MRSSVIAPIVAATLVFVITLTGCGGGGGGGDNAPAPASPAGNVDSTPPTVLSATPGSNATGVSGNSTVVVNFSEAVNGATTTSMRLSASGVALPGTVTQSVNRLTATFAPASPLACGIAHTVQLTSGITDVAGNALVPTSWSFAAKPIGAWSFVDGNAGTGINNNKAFNGATPRIVSLNSKLYAAWAEGLSGQIRVAVMAGTDAAPDWRFVDGNLPSVGINKTPGQVGTNPALAVHNGRLFAAWSEFNGIAATPAYQIRVAAYNGNDAAPVWNFVDSLSATVGLNKNPLRTASVPQLVVVAGKLYALWTEGKLLVPGNPALIPPTTDLFVNQVRVRRYDGDGTTSTWLFVDGDDPVNGINHITPGDAFYPQATEFNGKLYVTWDEAGAQTVTFPGPNPGDPDVTEPVHQIRAKVYDPASQPATPPASAWRSVDGGGIPGLNKDRILAAGDASFAVVGSKLYLIWGEYRDTPRVRQVRVRVFNGNDAAPSWALVDGGVESGINQNPTFTAGDPASVDSSQPPRLGAFNGQLYAMWAESNGPTGVPASTAQIRAKAYNGNDSAPAWTSVDGNGANGINKNVNAAGASALQTAGHPQLVALGSKLYAAWSESNGTARQVRVALAGCP